MFGWLKQKNDQIRAAMCIQELAWHLEQSDKTEIAAILIFAQIQKMALSSRDADLTRLFDLPSSCSREELTHLYGRFEEMRNEQALKQDRLSKQLLRMGNPMPVAASEQIRRSNRGIEVWMAGFGAAMFADQANKVRRIWQLLELSSSHIRYALEEIKTAEKITLEWSGSMDGVWQDCSESDARELCAFRPTQFCSGALG